MTASSTAIDPAQRGIEGLPRRIEFTLQLARVDDRQADPSGGTGGDGAPGEEWDDWDWWME